jgi:hypothetical protein
MCGASFGINPSQSQFTQRNRIQELRSSAHGMNGGANIMNKSWERQLSRSRTSANRMFGFVNNHRAPGSRDCDCRRKAIRARTNHDRVWAHGL